MGWKETCVLKQREEFCRAVLGGEVSKAEWCRRFGISRPTGDKWMERYLELGRGGLVDLSSAVHSHPNQVAEPLQQQLLQVRERYPTWGPKKIVGWLKSHGVDDVPSPSTAGEILKRAGLVVSRKRRRHATPSPALAPFGSISAPNQLWCADFKGWFRTGNGSRCDPLTITDAQTRYLLRCQGSVKTDTAHVQAIFDAAFREFGLPEAIRTDNGSPFASCGLAGLSRLSVWWLKLGIKLERIKPGHPEQNGRHERMHLTLKRETATPARYSLRQQQLAFDEFVNYYNGHRPHEGLGQQTPGTFYTPSDRCYTGSAKPFEYPTHMQVRQVRLRGEIKWHYKRVGLTKALVGERVGVEEIAEGIWNVWAGPMKLGWIDERTLRKVAAGPYGFVSLRSGSWK